MAEQDNPTPNANTTDVTTGDQPAARPEHIPEKFWDAGAGQVRIDDLAKSYVDLEKRQGGIRDEIRSEMQKEQFANRPESPDKYELKAPDESDIILMTEDPGDDYEPTEGKIPIVIDREDPLYQYWAKTSHELGLSNEQFNEAIHVFAQTEAARVKTPEQIEQERKAFFDKLGDNGKARVEHVYGQIKAALGDDLGESLADAVNDPKQVEALEVLLEKSGAAKFTAESTADGVSNLDEIEIRKIMAEPDYYNDPDKLRKVEDFYQRKYPGKVRTAAQNPAIG